MTVLNQAQMLAAKSGSAEVSREQQQVKGMHEAVSGKDSKDSLREACSDFEAIFVKKMWQKMKSTVPKEGYLHNKHEDMYLSMFDQKFAEKMASERGMGLGDMLYEQLRSRLESESAKSGPEVDTSVEVPPREENPGENAAREKYLSQMQADMESASDPRAKADILARQIESLYGEPAGGISLQSSASLQGDPVNPRARSSVMTDISWPVKGELSSGFGWRDDPFTGEKAWHSGVDISVPKGSEVQSCWPGEVVFSGEKSGYGNLVVVQHQNGWKSFYGHNKENLVDEGEFVQDGQKIALSGDTGRSTGPHLHFELRQGEQAWDPQMIRKRVLAGLSVGDGQSG